MEWVIRPRRGPSFARHSNSGLMMGRSRRLPAPTAERSGAAPEDQDMVRRDEDGIRRDLRLRWSNRDPAHARSQSCGESDRPRRGAASGGQSGPFHGIHVGL